MTDSHESGKEKDSQEEAQEAKVFKLSKHLQKKSDREVEISPEEESYEARIDSLEALFVPASLLVDDISYLILSLGSNEEIEAWQKFASRFNLMLCAFQDFWEIGSSEF